MKGNYATVRVRRWTFKSQGRATRPTIAPKPSPGRMLFHSVESGTQVQLISRSTQPHSQCGGRVHLPLRRPVVSREVWVLRIPPHGRKTPVIWAVDARATNQSIGPRVGVTETPPQIVARQGWRACRTS